MTLTTLFTQTRSKVQFDLGKKVVFVMLLALLSPFLSVSQCKLTINTQPPKLQRICVPFSSITPRLQVAAVTCPGGNLTYQWQKLRPTSIGGTGKWEDIGTSTPGYIGANTPTLDITTADSIIGKPAYYKYRNMIISSGGINPCISGGTTACIFQRDSTNVSEIIGVRKPIVKYNTPLNTDICEYYNGGPDQTYNLYARVHGVSPRDTLKFTWRTVDLPSYSHADISAHPRYTFWVSTRLQGVDTATLRDTIRLNNANNTPILLTQDQSKFYLEVFSPTCGLSDTNTVPKRILTVSPVPNLSVLTPNINICQGDAFNMRYSVSNARRDAVRGSTFVNWSVRSITGPSSLRALFNDTTGTGNITKTISVPGTHGLAVGTYTITLGTIVNTTDVGSCSRILPSSTITVNVYPKPTVEFLTPNPPDTLICQGQSGIIKFKVSNAVFNSTDIGWTVTVTDPSGILSPATLTGQGNKIITNTFPNNLPIGQHVVTLTGISTSGTPSICAGTVIGIKTDTIKVIPIPNATINTTITIDKCAGFTKDSFDIIVSNAVYPDPILGNINLGWSINYTDSTTGTLVGSLTGSGNGVFKKVVSNSLPIGTHTIRLNSITVTSPNASLGVIPTCSKTLFGQSKRYRVYPTPSATFSRFLDSTCEGSTISPINLVVTGANYPPALSWNLVTSGKFTGAAAGSVVDTVSTALTGVFYSSGSGNGNFSFTPPSTLAPGRYKLRLNSISLANTPSCTKNLTDSFTLHVFPQPTATIFGTKMLDSICEGSTVSYSIGISNAYYSPFSSNRNWSLSYINGLGGTLPGSPRTGSGGQVLGAFTTSSGLTTGDRSLTLSAITNTTNNCTNVLPGTEATNTKLTRKIYPKPNANLSATSINVCQGTSSTFNVVISNARKRVGASGSPTIPQPWTLSTIGTYEGAAAGSPSVNSTSLAFPTSGTDNGTFAVTVPDTLRPGRYIFTLNNPILNVSPLFCTGTSVPNNKITINVWPKPTVTITPAVDSACQGQQKNFNIVIGNAFYEPTSSNVNWSLSFNFTKPAGAANVVAGLTSPLVGSGNSNTVYTTTGTSKAGTYTLDVTNLNNTSHTCSYTATGQYKLVVKQRPRLFVNVSQSDSEVCFMSRAKVTYRVDSVAAGQAWSFTYTAINTTPSGTKTVRGVGPVASDTFMTNPFSTVGAGTISFSPITLTAANGCASTITTPSHDLNVAGIPNVTSNTTNGTGIVCGNAATGRTTVTFNIVTSNMIVGPYTKTWKITYDIIGTQDTSAAPGNQIFRQLGVTKIDTGNGAFQIVSPHQTYNGTSADAGIADVRRMIIRKIEFIGASPLNCSNTNLTDSITTFTVNPRPRFIFTKTNPDNICVTEPVITGYNIFGFKSGDAGSFQWNGTNPTTTANIINVNGPSVISGSITTPNTTLPGLAIQTITQVSNTTTGCVAILDPLPRDTTIVDPPSQPGTLNGSATVCEGNNSGTLYLTGPIVGKVVRWEYSENDGFTWLNYAHTDTFMNYTNASLTRRWRVVVKNLTCPINRSNEVIVFVHPQPKVQIVNFTSGLCKDDSVRFTLNITGVPTNHTWKLDYTKAGFSSNNGNATFTGRGSGQFNYVWGGMTNFSGTATIQLKVITNDTVNCSKDYTSSAPHLMTIVVGNNSVAGPIALVASPSDLNLPQNVCRNSSGTLKYKGAGNVLWWYHSNKTSGTFPSGWDSTFNPTYTHLFNNIDTTTRYRVRVRFGSCPSVVSASDNVLNVIKLPIATITGSDTICENSTRTLNVQLNGQPGGSVLLKWLEGSTTKSGTFSLGSNPPSTTSPSTITTSTLTTTTNVVLQSIEYTNVPACRMPLYTDAIAIVTVNPLPTVTINSVTTPVCQNATSTVAYTVSGVASTTTWSLTYRVGSSTFVTSGKGGGTFSLNTPSLTAAGTINVDFLNITTTNLRTNCTSGTLTGITRSIVVHETTTPGSVASSVTICKGGSATINFTPGNGTILKWDFSNTSAAGPYSSQSTNTNNITLTNITNDIWVTATSRNGVCSEATTSPIKVTVRDLPVATISGSTTVCSGATATLNIAVTNTYSNDWTVEYLEGTTTKTRTGNGDGTFSITTSSLTSNTDVTLQKITMNNVASSTNPNCGPSTLSSTVTVNVNPNPSATLNSVVTPVCQSSTANSSFSVTVTGVPTGQGWSLRYTLNGTAQTAVTNSGSGTFTFPLTLSNSGNVNLVLTGITNTLTNCVTDPLTGSVSATIVVDATTTAGTISNTSASVVCTGTNSGTLTYSGGNGTIVRWEYAEYTGNNWIALSNSSSTLNWSNLTKTTRYRVIVKNGSCLEASSASVTITVRPLPTATISGSNTVCQGSTSDLTVTTSNTFGNSWSIGFLEGTTTRTLTGSGDGNFTLTTLALNGQTDVTLQSIVLTHTPDNSNPGGCPNTISSKANVNVTPMPNATINFVGTPICQGSTSSIQFTVSNISTGQGWSINYTEAGITKTTTGNGPGTYTINTAALSTVGANVVTLNTITNTSATPNCTRTLTGQSLTITVDATTVAGAVRENGTVCKGSNSGTLNYSGGNGAIVRWEFSINGGATWSTTGTTASSYSYSNLTQTTSFRVIAKNSSCLEAISAIATITVRDLPTATVGGSNTICQGTTGDLTVSVSNTFGNPWTITYLEGTTTRSLSGTGDGNFTLTTLTLSTKTDVTLQSIILTHTPTGSNPGNCANTLSSTATVDVIPLPNATLNSVTTPVCQGSTSTISVTVSNVSTGQGWSLSYTEAGVSRTQTGNGPGTYTYTTNALNTSGANVVTLNSITITSSTPNCTRTLSGQSMTINVDATTVAGTASANSTVCRGTNSGTLSYTGGNGAIVRWEFSINGGTTWSATGTTAASYSFSNLTQTTNFRVIVKNGSCLEAISNTVTVTVRELPTATVGSSNTVCQGTSGTLTVTVSNSFGNPWTITFLEGTTTRTLSGTGDGNVSLTTLTLSTKTDVTLQGIVLTHTPTSTNPGNCANTLSSTATVDVIPLPNATINSVNTPVCQGSTSSFSVTISNIQTGQGWSLSYTEAGVSKTATGNGPGTYTYTTSALNTAGGNVVTLNSVTITSSSPTCTRTLSGQSMTINVDATTVAGTLGENATVCKGTNSGTLNYAGGNGAIVRWEYSINGGTTWSATGTTASSYSYSNLTQTTNFRVIVKNGSCLEAISNTITITVRDLPTATVGSSTTVCQGTTGNLTVSVSNSFGNPWTITFLEGTTTRTLSGTGDGNFTLTTQTLSTKTDVTLQGIVLTHTPTGTNPGNCANTLSSTATVDVIALPNATLNSVKTPICQGNTSGFQYTISNIPTGQGWSLSYTEGGVSKTATGNGPGTYSIGTGTLSTPGKVAITFVSVTITSSTPTCTRSLSATDTIIVDATTVAGSITGASTVCKGSNSGTLTYSGGNGGIVRWEFSINGGSTWSTTGTTAATYSYSNVSQTTQFRVIAKNGACGEAISAPTTIAVRELPFATISGSTTICQNTSTGLTVNVSNSFGNPWTITYLEGTTTSTLNGSGDGNATLTTSSLSVTTDVTLVSITLTHSGTSTNPACGPNSLTSSATVRVTPLPTATLNKVVSPICQGNTSSFEFTVSNLATGQGWSMNYTEGSTTKTTSGNGPGTYTVSTSALSAGTVTITLNSVSTTGLTTNCTRNLTGQSMDITVNATTTVGALGTDITVCRGNNSGNLTYNVGSSNGAVVRWESSVISASGPWTAISNTTNSQQYINLSQTTFFRVIVKNGNCAERESNVVTVSVQEIPVAFIGGSSTICAGNTASLTVNIINVSSGQRSQLNYLEGTTSKSINIFGTSGTITTGVLNTNTDITLVSITSFDSTISSVFRKGCSNITLTSTATVNVNALPTATLSSVGGPICQGNSTNYTVTVTNVPTGHGWNLTGTIESNSISPNPSGTGSGTFTFNTPVLNTPPSAAVAFTLITNSTTGCTRVLTESRNITVNATTTVGTIGSDATVCKGDNAGSVDYTASGTNGSIVRWESSTVSPSTGFNGIMNTANSQTYSNLTATTFYRAVVRNGVCNEVNSNVVTITVRDLPNATIAGNQTICEGSSANFTITVSRTFGQSFKVYYLIGSTLDSLVRTGDGVYTINTGNLQTTVDITLLRIVQVSGSPICTQQLSGTITITVNDLPRASFTTIPNRLCQGSTVDFTIDVSWVRSTRNWSLTYTVNAPSSSSATTETRTGTGSGSFSITTTAAVQPTTSTITLATITNTSTGCSRTLSDAKVINVDPTTVGGTLSTGTNTTVCRGSNSGTITLTGNTGSVVRWEASTDNGSTWSTINNTTNSHSYSNITQTTRYRAFVQSGVCAGAFSSTVIITVNELPTATVNNATICAGNTASLTVTVGNTFGQSWTLTFAEGSTTRTLTGTGDGNFTLTTGVLNTTTTIALKSIQITSGTVLCSSTLTGVGVVTVNALPTVDHNTAPTSVCDGSTVDFTVVVDNVLVGQSWTLNYRIGTGSNNTFSGTGPGNFTITSPVFTNSTSARITQTIEITSITNTTTGCTRTASEIRNIDVFPKTVGGTTAATVNPLCANSATTSNITVTGFIGNVIRWEYSDDNQATWQTLSNTAATITVSNLSQTREYRAVIQSGPCAAANSSVVKVTVIPTVEAEISGTPQICAGKVALFNILVTKIGTNENWSLTYRVNGTLQTAITGRGPGNFPLTVGPPATSTAGTVTVKLETITNTTFSCANNNLSSQAIAIVHPNPIANFTVANTCRDSSAVFINTSTILSGTLADFTWNFGNGSTSKDGNPTHTYNNTGNFSVTLLAQSAMGCRDSITKTITIFPRPVANFSFRNTCQDTAVKFTDGSSIAAGSTIRSYFWNFGDGSTSTAQNPSRKYAAAGTYTVTLTVVSSNGCASTKVQNVTVWELPEPNYVASPVCENSVMNFVNTSSIGVGTMTYRWDFAGQGNSGLTNPSHTFTGFGSFNVSLTATSNNGCVKTLVKPVTVWANPIADFTVADKCIGETSRFINTSRMPAGSTDQLFEFFWNFGDSAFSTGKDPLHTYAKDGIYSVSTRATSNRGCVNTITKSAVVHPLPVVTFKATKTKFCDRDTATLTANDNMRQYVWTLNGTVVGTTRSIVVSKQGWYHVRITSPIGGCSNEDSIFITVWPLPVADAGRDTSIHKGQSVNLKGKGAGIGGSYDWSPKTFLTPAAGNVANVTSKPDATIEYLLTVTDINGCKDTDNVKINILVEFVLKVHNVITPNGDGFNDTWIIDNIEAYPDAEVAIFNRYGMEVFNQTGYLNTWNGDDLPDGAYYYVITIKSNDKVYKGAISLLRNKTN